VSFDEGRYRLAVVTPDGRQLSFTTSQPTTAGTEALISIDPSGIVDLAKR
jgi:Tol biopolymer transport system component